MELKDNIVGARIYQYRISRKMSQEELGQRIGLSKQLISRIENGQRKIDINELIAIAETIGEPLEYFYAKEPKFLEVRNNWSEDSLPRFMVDFLNDLEEYLGGGGSVGAIKLATKFTKPYSNLIKQYNKTFQDCNEVYNKNKDSCHDLRDNFCIKFDNKS